MIDVGFLIYPYWNINFLVVVLLVLPFEVSNLSILEYKSILGRNDTKYIKQFLIYPYWNINTNKRGRHRKRINVSNLSILEYKFF